MQPERRVMDPLLTGSALASGGELSTAAVPSPQLFKQKLYLSNSKIQHKLSAPIEAVPADVVFQ
jgi:hypothetical protein